MTLTARGSGGRFGQKPRGQGGEERAWRGRQAGGRGPGGGWLPWAPGRECSSYSPPPWQRRRKRAAGDLDPTFSGDGKQTTDFGVGASARRRPCARRTARSSRWERADRRLRGRPLQPGRLARHELLRRRQADDQLRGLRRGDWRGAPGDGKIVVGRSAATAAPADFALARYNPNGSLDTSFSGDGKQTTDFGGFDEGERGGAPGRRQDRRGRQHRHGAATSRSPATTPTARSTRASPATASRRPTSGASATGRTGWRSRRTARSSRSATRTDRGDFALARYNPNGSLDTSFSGDGKQTTDFGGFDRGERGGAPGRRQDRRGRRRRRSTSTATSRSPATTRTARSTRASPATASRRPTSVRGADEANDVAIQANGRIVAVGVAGGGATGQDFALARYNPNGSLDTSFSGDGRKRTNFGGYDSGERGGAPGRRQDRRGRRRQQASSRWPAIWEAENSSRWDQRLVLGRARRRRRPPGQVCSPAGGGAMTRESQCMAAGTCAGSMW